jgi:hypothetical protein
MTQIVYNKNGVAFDIDAIATDINGKADKDLLNTDTDRGVLVESYSNGSSWYRVYYDGWCEQGGETNKATNISLLKSYANTNYIITSGLNGTSSSGESPAFNKTTSSFTVSHAYVTSLNFMWQACGYIAQS